MNLTEILNSLQILKNRKITKKELATVLNILPQNINRLDNQDLSSNQLELIENEYNISLTDYQMNAVKLKYFTDVIGSCGGGTFEQSQNFEMLQLPTKLIENYSLNKEYAIINAYGDSMLPTITDEDKLIIEFKKEQIIDNRVYVFTYEDKLFIKRLVQNIDEIVVISDNPNKEAFKTKTIAKKDFNKFNLIGQVVGIIFREIK